MERSIIIPSNMDVYPEAFLAVFEMCCIFVSQLLAAPSLNQMSEISLPVYYFFKLFIIE